MKILAGTSKGVFSIEGDQFEQVLESRGVRDLVDIDGRVYAGTGAGVYFSEDHGKTWSDRELAEHEVWQVRGGPDGTVYAGTQPAGLFRLDTNGHWTEISSFTDMPESGEWCIPVEPKLPGRARALVIDAHDAERLWVGVEVGGILRSDDGTESWKFGLPGGNPDLHMMCAHPDDSQVLFASTGYGRLDGGAEMIEGNAGVFRSDDSGATRKYVWQGITPRYSRPMCIDPRSPFSLTVGSAPTAFSNFREQDGAQAMLFRSDDRGESWRSLCDSAHTPSRENIHGLAPDPRHTVGVVVGTDMGEVWTVSDDAKWTMEADGLPPVLAVHPLAN